MIYLAGPIFGRDDSEALDWRREVTAELGPALVIDPMRRDYRGREWLHDEIVALDKADIASASVVLAMATAPSWGTAMEVLFAWERRIPVVAIASWPVSPWLVHHAAVVVDNLEEAVTAALDFL